MKFGKRLQSQLEETLPEWRDKYLSYKQLKKRLKQLSAPECFTEAAFSSPEREGGARILQDEASITTSRAADNGSPPGNVPVLSEGQDSSVNGGSVTGAKSSSGSAGGAVSECLHPDLASMDLSAEEADFIHLLNAELEKFNTFFIEKEEEYVIRLQELKERCEKLKDRSALKDSDSNLDEEMINIRKEIVNFHGEMVLLENYSSLNYTGLVKILKKHDKRTGALLRMPFIRNVLHQPFFTTELLSKLVRECETNLQSLFPPLSEAGEVPAAPAMVTKDAENSANGTMAENQRKGALERYEGDANVLPASATPSTIEQAHYQGEDVDNIYRSTLAALRTIKELRRGSSTYSIFSLPPFNKGEDEDSLDAAIVLSSNTHEIGPGSDMAVTSLAGLWPFQDAE
ncbi:hypothetical protein GOP47_0002808 [Adiantum capillus-veneris]|uniref:SPX domain-containing protein n=1 Tax=Adiantum capillus-veneris TaxID=13818 RepID=A0A9D4ZRY4_ADICA|nr:hypothetical protein GOP47_0002808 [Adiantum capillus-veneris]